MNGQAGIAMERMIFRNTHGVTGRRVAVTPQNSTMRHLSYARIVLNPSQADVSFSNGEQETGLVCLAGKATIKTGGKEFELEKYDSLYVPRDSVIEVSSSGGADLAVFSCDVAGKYYVPQIGSFIIYFLMVALMIAFPAGLYGRRA